MKTNNGHTVTVYKHGPTIKSLHVIEKSAINYNGTPTPVITDRQTDGQTDDMQSQYRAMH